MLSIIVITVENRDSVTEIYGVETYRNLVHELTSAIARSVGRTPRESGELPGTLLLVLPGMKNEAATALGWHVQGCVPREIELGGLLMPVEVQVMVETHDGVTRTVDRPGIPGAREVIAP